MKVFRFTTPEQYMSYDFDDSHCFFYHEILEFIESNEKTDPAAFNDGRQVVDDIIRALLKTYDGLIINEDEQRLYGEKNGEMVLIKEGINEPE